MTDVHDVDNIHLNSLCHILFVYILIQANDPGENERSGESGFIGVEPLRQRGECQLPLKGKVY